MKIRSLVAVSICGAGLSVTAVANAQQDPQGQKPATQQPGVKIDISGQPGHQSRGKFNDHTMASCVAIANQEEIAIAKFAEEKAHSPKVKEFASMIAKDHKAYLQKLEKFAPEASRDGFLTETGAIQSQASNDESRSDRGEVRVKAANTNVKVANRDSQVQQTAATDEQRNDRHHGHSMAMLELHREIAQECLSEAKEGMSKKDSADFDKCFIGHQIAKHEGMRATLTVFQRHATGDLRDVVSEGLQATEKHLKKAEEIMKELESNSNSKTTVSKK